MPNLIEPIIQYLTENLPHEVGGRVPDDYDGDDIYISVLSGGSSPEDYASIFRPRVRVAVYDNGSEQSSTVSWDIVRLVANLQSTYIELPDGNRYIIRSPTHLSGPTDFYERDAGLLYTLISFNFWMTHDDS